MDLSSLPPGMIGQLAGMVEGYITSSRGKYSAGAVPLTAAQKSAMQAFLPRRYWTRRGW